jgi:uncharacterized membrane protein YesL
MAAYSGKGHWLETANHWSTPVLANILWLVVSLPLVTLPLATIGLLGVMFRWMAGRNAALSAAFLGTIRRNWLRSYLVFGANLLIGGLIFVNFRLFEVMDMTDIFALLSRSITILVSMLLFLVNVYVWPLLAVWDQPLKVILKFAWQLVFAQPLWGFVTGIGVIAPFLVSLFLPVAVFITVTAACSAYIACRGVWFVMGKYRDPEEFAWIRLD